MSEKLGLGSRRIRSALSLMTALLLVGSISYLGVHTYRSSHASSSPTIYASPSSVSINTGATLSVTLRENSGMASVNAVQASLSYDTDKLQLISINDGIVFPVNADTNTATPGLIRVSRANADREVTGDNAIVTINFKVIGNGTGTITIDKANSLLASSTDNKDILENVGGGRYTATPPPIAANPSLQSTPTVHAATPSTAGTDSKPVLTMDPASGSLAPGATLSVGIRLNSYGVAVTTVQATVAFPANQLQYMSVTEGGDYTVAMRSSAGNGAIDIIRAVSGGSAGLSGDNPVVTLNFKVIGTSGSIPLTLGANSAAFDATGSGQSILNTADSRGATFEINPNGATSLAPAANSSSGDKKSQSSFFASPAQAFGIVYHSDTGNASMSTAEDGTALAELDGEVELKPILNPAIFAADPNASLQKVEYYINSKLVATASTAPFTHKFNTRTMRNGTYTVALKSYYSGGIVDTRTDKLKVNNKVTLAYVMRHYLVSAVAVSALLAAFVLVILKLVLPRIHRGTDTVATADHDAMYGFLSTDRGYGDAGPVAQDPLVVAPSAALSSSQSASDNFSLLPQLSNAAQTTDALPDSRFVPAPVPVSAPQATTTVAPTPITSVAPVPMPAATPAASPAVAQAPILQHQPLNPPSPVVQSPAVMSTPTPPVATIPSPITVPVPAPVMTPQPPRAVTPAPPHPDISSPAAVPPSVPAVSQPQAPAVRTINITTPDDHRQAAAAIPAAAPQKFTSDVIQTPASVVAPAGPLSSITQIQPQA